MTRPSRDQTFLDIARTLSLRSTCAKSAVGCVLTDVQGNIVSTGYNGVARGLPHCNEGFTCQDLYLSGDSDGCLGIHAEINAIARCLTLDAVYCCYVTRAPCRSCVKALLATKCSRIVTPQTGLDNPQSKSIWELSGRVWEFQGGV